MAETERGASDVDIFTMDPTEVVDTDQLPALEDPATEATARPSTAQTAEEAPGEQAPSFVPEDAEITPDVQAKIDAINRKMQANYARRTAALQDREKSVEDMRQSHAVVQRFYSDPQYAAQVLQQRAQQLGMTLTPASGAAPAGQSQGSPSAAAQQRVPESTLAAVNKVFEGSPELAFLAPMIAQVAHEVSQANVQERLAPLQQELATRQQAEEARSKDARNQEIQRALQELEAEGDDWKAYDNDLSDFVEFLTNAVTNHGPLHHPKYGNLMRIVYNVVTGDQRTQAAAQAEAGRRLQRALTNRTSQSTGARSPGVNTQDLIAKAKTPQEKIAIAFRAAYSEVANGR